MLGFSMVNLVRRHPKKLDKALRQELVGLYKPFRWIPCFLHSPLERIFKQVKKFAVIIEFEDTGETSLDNMWLVHNLTKQHIRSKIKHKYPGIRCCSAFLTASALEDMLNNHSHIKRIHKDREVHALLDKAVPSIKADTLHANGLTGKDVTIAVVDTGIYPHPDLTRPESRIVAFKDLVNNRLRAYDDNGHGTHCAGDAAGNGFSSNAKYVGVAPDANLVGVKVLDKQGSGSLSTVMAGIQWCIDNKQKNNIDIISMSLGSTATVPAAEDPMVKIVEKAWDAGIVVCVAAGNEGPDQKTISSPGISAKVITVGAMNDMNTVSRKDDQVADFSSRGPTLDGLNKPDVLCPGVNIISLRSPRSYLDKVNRSSRVDKDYFSLSGTSMATPICAGLVALMLQNKPGLTPNQVKNNLLTTAEDWGLPYIVQGQGYVDAQKALSV